MNELRPDLAARKAAVLRATSLEAVVRRRLLKLRAKGREFEASCPFHQETTPSFTVSPDKGFFHCFGCGEHGDLFGFVMRHDGLDFMGALVLLENEAGAAAVDHIPGAGNMVVRPQANPSRKRVANSSYIDSSAAARLVWRAAGTARGSLVETYLRARGIDPAATGVLDVVRYHPRCPTGLWRQWESADDARGHCPAMLAPICRVEGPPGKRELVQQGVHITYLAADGSDKKRFALVTRRDGSTETPPSRKIWGELSGGAVPLPRQDVSGHHMTTAWIDDRPGTELVVGEGLESTLSLIALRSCARGGFATLALNNLQGFPIEEKVGRDFVWPLWNLRPDPARTMFVLPEADGAVAIGVDADMKGLKQRRVQSRMRGPVERRDLSGAERTEICAALAAAAWRRAGAKRVDVLRPQMGRDFNDG